MGLYNFQERFVPFIKDGSKTHTIRTIRKYPQKVGALMHLFCGLRTKYARRIIPAEPCKAIKTIFIYDNGDVFIHPDIFDKERAKMVLLTTGHRTLRKTMHLLTDDEKDILAWHDGFRFASDPLLKKGCFEIMLHWWKQTHQLPFAGHIQYWK